MFMISESARIYKILCAPMRHGGVAEAPDFLNLGRIAFARHHEGGNFRSPCPLWVFPKVLLVLGRVHHDARAVDDELGGSLRSDLVGEEVWSGSPRGDDAGIGDVHLALGRGRVLDELLRSPEAELVHMHGGAVEAGRSRRHCRAVRPSLRAGSPCLCLDIYDYVNC